MNKKKNKKPHHHPKTNPKPKAAIPDLSRVDMPATESTKHDAVIAKQPENKTADEKGGKMKEIRWTDKLIAAATVVIALATIVQGYELVTGSRDTHKLAEATLVASRAWVSPLGVHLTSSLEAGVPVRYQIHIANPGKEPALGMIWKAIPRLVDYIPEGGLKEPDMGVNTSCDGLEPEPTNGTVLYPQEGGANFEIPLKITDEKIVDAALKRSASLVIDGCFAYMTDKETHTSAFRYFLRDVPNMPSLTIGQNGQTTSEWRFNLSLSGNDAN